MRMPMPRPSSGGDQRRAHGDTDGTEKSRINDGNPALLPLCAPCLRVLRAVPLHKTHAHPGRRGLVRLVALDPARSTIRCRLPVASVPMRVSMNRFTAVCVALTLLGAIPV